MNNPKRYSRGPRWAWAGKALRAMLLPVARCVDVFHSDQSAYSRERITSLRERIQRGEKSYLLGIQPAGHNSGVGLIEVSAGDGIRLIGNHEEERFRAIKHYQQYPAASVQALLRQMDEIGIRPSQIHAACAGWDYAAWAVMAAQTIVEEFPSSLRLLSPNASPHMHASSLVEARTAPRKLGAALGLNGKPFPIISLRHHDNHAWLSWGCSPFAKSEDPVIVLVVDGAGDEGAISAYVVENSKLRLLYANDSIWDSLGLMYGMLSSSQGGWPLLSSEGRYMGAAAWGDTDRLTNPYYAQLRDVFALESAGQVYLNRGVANWHTGGCVKPYKQRLVDILGPPLLPHQMWNPDAVLKVEDIAHSPITVDRVDKAAAVQMVFEDALFHIVQNLIRTTKATKLVLTGGTALNCVANMLLMERFNANWYERNLGLKNSTLHLWVPPIPGDMGVAAGAAYHFACLAGARPGAPLEHVFYCGCSYRQDEIQTALKDCAEVRSKDLGNINNRLEMERLADLMAFIVSQNGVIGIFQGPAETGPRALGHRSILANPMNPDTRATLNRLVKFRELIRPLAPMATMQAAQRYFHLDAGAADNDFNAYNYMVLTARAKEDAYEQIPSVIHKDGTCRIQIVREHTNPLIYAYLKALGRRIGVEVSVNTSLNVGAPIAQTPLQGLETLQRSQGMHGLIMIGAEGEAVMAWHDVDVPPKDSGRTLEKWFREWNVTKRNPDTGVSEHCLVGSE